MKVKNPFMPFVCGFSIFIIIIIIIIILWLINILKKNRSDLNN